MKVTMLIQPFDMFSFELEKYFHENNIQYKTYRVSPDGDLPVPEAECIFSNIKGTPAVYVDGKYIADFIAYYENGCVETHIEESQGWSHKRLSDVIAVIIIPNCRGCKETEEYLQAKQIIYKAIKIDDDDGPTSKFIKDFFVDESTDEKQYLNFPYVIINGENRPDWKEYIESEDFKE